MASGTFSVDGLISGMNTSQMVSELMKLERRPLNALENSKARASSRLKALKDLASRVSSLRSAALALTNRSTVGARRAVTDTPTTQAAKVTVSAGSAAALGNFDVTVSQLATATRVISSQPIGQAIDTAAALASAGFGTAPTTGTFSINGKVITIDASTVLSDGTDAPGANTIPSKINNAGAGVTATIESDGLSRPNVLKLTAAAGEKIQMGSGADTSNFLTAARLLGAPVAGKTAASVTGSAIAAGALAATTMVINGTSITTTATGAANTAEQNAASIAADINAANTSVTAVGMPNGTIVLTQKNLGSERAIDISNAGTGTGFIAGITANGTDDYVLGTSSLGSVQAAETLADGRFATAISPAEGSFIINGVTIEYDAATDTLNSVLSRINTSKAGVSASYDPILDRVRLTATQMGSTAVALEDQTGNFLAATGLLGAAQAPGQNAEYTISTVNGGQTLTSSSNTVTGVLPGVTLNLLATTTSPVAVTISMDPDATVKAVRSFIDAYNNTVSFIQDQTAYDANTGMGGILLGDSTVRSLQASMANIMSSIPSGLSGGNVRTFADVGITSGKIGSSVGTTKSLVLDESKLRDALASNSAVVADLFAAPATASLQAGGTGSIAAIKGSPIGATQDGTWQITSDAVGKLTAVFTPTVGSARAPVEGTITAGGVNSTLVPGLTLYGAATLAAGTNTITINSQPRGVGVRLRDFLDGLVSSTGSLTKRQTVEEGNIQSLQKQMQGMQQRLDDKEERLRLKFAKVERALAQVRAQGAQLQAQLAGLG
ncbi:MAG: hypothetical protein EPO21_24660 [Chloroflexota bacterium]|nr:MAG: hypothetical protein EPO21_24660 [Chloroflexota bacterium]